MPGILGGPGQRGLGIMSGLRQGLEPARQSIRTGLSSARSGLQQATRGPTISQSVQQARANVRTAITGEDGEPVVDRNGRFIRQPAEAGIKGPGGRQFQFQSETFVDPSAIRPGPPPVTRRLIVNTDL